MTSLAPPVDPDAARLEELGYRQELGRGLRLFDNAAIGFAGISPVVGLYAVALVGLAVAGPAWVWVLPSRWWASVCCWPCTRSWRRSFRSPGARTSGAVG